jgi:hypothetical protein
MESSTKTLQYCVRQCVDFPLIRGNEAVLNIEIRGSKTMAPAVMNVLDFSLFGGYCGLVAVLLLYGSDEKSGVGES